ncbi:MAG: HD domain-containing phosphohydrolase [Candidatus Eisenbacteria bacterium]
MTKRTRDLVKRSDETPAAAAGGAPAKGALAQAAPGQETPASNAPPTEYFPIPLANLHAEEHAGIRFYVRLADGQHYLPYGDSDLALTSRHKEELEQRGIRYVYITAEDKDAFLGGLEEHLGDIVTDAAMDPLEKARILYDCMAQRSAQALENPRAQESVARVPALFEPVVDYLAGGPVRLAHLSTCMSFNYRTHTHSTNVCLLGLALGLRLGLSSEELIHLGTGLLLHDVGKAEIDRAILGKLEPLSEEEWQIVRTHPTRGVQYLEEAGLTDAPVLQVVGHHHERCTGKGYPDGLAERQIHLFAKIAGLVDVFDALTTERVFRRALGSFPAVKTMQNQMRADFSPLLFRELVLLLGSSHMNEVLSARSADELAQGRAHALETSMVRPDTRAAA